MGAGAVLVFSLPMLNFALAYGIRTWSDWNLAVCFLLSFAANVLIALVLTLIGWVYAKKTTKSKGPQKVAASMKESAGVLQKAKPHPRPAPALEDRSPAAIEAVARSSS
jgi:membrane protein implicated in regulation of membrane protease activity